MATTSKEYVSKLQIQSNIEEALENFQKLYIKFSEMPKAVEGFNKALKKSEGLEKVYYDMMTAIHKTTKRVSELSKVVALPKKQLEGISDVVTMLESAMKGFSAKDFLDPTVIKDAKNTLDGAVLSLKELEATNQKAVDNFDKQSMLLKDISKLEGVIESNSDRYRDSTRAVLGTYGSIVGKVKTIKDMLKEAETEGLSARSIETIEKKIREVKKDTIGLNNLTENYSRKLADVDKFLKDSATVAKDFTNETAKANFDNVVKRAEELKRKLEDLKKTGVKESFEGSEEELKKINEDANKTVDFMLQIKKLEDQSVAGMVKKAKLEHEANKAYIKQTMKRGGIGGVVDTFSAVKKAIPTAAVAKFGETGVVAMKGITTAATSLMSMFAPLAMFGGVLAAVSGMFELEKKVKAARKQMFMMAADSNLAGKGIAEVDSTVGDMSKRLDSFNLVGLGINFEKATEAAQGFVREGFKAQDVVNDLTSSTGGMFAEAVSLGMSIEELTGRAGELRKQFGLSLSGIDDAFETLRKSAKNAGINISIFFDKVINAATGLALWGKKVGDVSVVYSKLFKAMKLPEAIGTELAAKMVKSFSDMSTEMQIVTYQQGGGAKRYKKQSEERLALIDAEIDAARKQKDFAKADQLEMEKSQYKEQEKKGGKDLSAQMQRSRLLNVGNQIGSMMQLAGSKFVVDFDQNVEDLSKKMSDQQYSMEKLSEIMNWDREMTEGMTRALRNVKLTIDKLNAAAQGIEGNTDENKRLDAIIDITGGSQRIAVYAKRLSKNTNKLDKAALKELVTQFPFLAGKIEEGEINYDKLEKAVNDGIGTPEQKSKEIFNDLSKMSKKQLDVFAKGLESIPGLSDDQRKALAIAEENSNLQEKQQQIANILSKVNTSSDFWGKAQADIATKVEADKQKEIGAETLRQTKSTKQAIEDAIGTILRDGFRWLEKLYGAFVHAFPWTGVVTDAATAEENANKQTTEIKGQAAGMIDKPGSKARSKEFLTDKLNELQDAYDEKLKEYHKQKTISDFVPLADFGSKKAGAKWNELHALEIAIANLQNALNEIPTEGSTAPLVGSRAPSTILDKLKEKKAKGGVVGGTSFSGDKVLAALNSGELVIPKEIWQNAIPGYARGGITPDAGMGTTGSMSSKTINDNRVINLYVNQNDRKQIEQIVLNAIYTDKM
jgi:hypothetical protein